MKQGDPKQGGTNKTHRIAVIAGDGIGPEVMREVAAVIAETYALGALGTGSHAFYERLGWRTWRGPAFVRTRDGDRPTPDANACRSTAYSAPRTADQTSSRRPHLRLPVSW